MQVPENVQEDIKRAVTMVKEHDYQDAVVVDEKGEVLQGQHRLLSALDLREQGHFISIPIVVATGGLKQGQQVAVVQL